MAAMRVSREASGPAASRDLRPGTYTVQQDEPAGWIDGKDSAGSLGGTVTNDQIAGIHLPSGGTAVNNNFGELKPSSLAGYVYFDANNNGSKDAGETGIPEENGWSGRTILGSVALCCRNDAEISHRFPQP